MGCIYHPDLDSIACCDHCNAELCESCAIRVEDGRTFCHRCILALSLEDVRSETTMKERADEDRRVGLQEKWRPSYIQSVLAVGAVVVLVLIALRFYWSQTELRPQIILDVTAPVELLAGLQEALALYSVEHGNRYPDSLYELIPGYLPDVGENSAALRYLDYNLDEHEGYRLRMKPGSPLSGENLIATALDIHPVQREK